jgi:hypothetical protein
VAVSENSIVRVPPGVGKHIVTVDRDLKGRTGHLLHIGEERGPGTLNSWTPPAIGPLPWLIPAVRDVTVRAGLTISDHPQLRPHRWLRTSLASHSLSLK